MVQPKLQVEVLDTAYSRHAFAPMIGKSYEVRKALELPTSGKRYCVEPSPKNFVWLPAILVRVF
ncbi:hypothetical protein [Anthocerotibacter panamensis]|uniref:hypothetical protein n=1 Tax=Anthocerotibacter panamensis TaxID=2857077 RepID=UPI001C404762|nr:hypothetical protein [Anthocerotibacter panamensis]